jgi:acyl carrier protein
MSGPIAACDHARIGVVVTAHDIESIVKAYILDAYLPGANPDELTPTTPLVTGGILDSLATVRLVSFLEERFGIAMEAWEVNPENLDSLDRITHLVQQKLPTS